MQILNRKDWNTIIAKYKFNTILNVIGDYPVYLEKGGAYITNNENPREEAFQMKEMRILATDIDINSVSEFIEQNTLRTF